MNTVPLEQLTMDSFSTWVGVRFRVLATPANTIDLELTQVTSSPSIPSHGAARAEYESFSVVFSGPAVPVLPQRIYAFENDAIGRFDLFIVPVGRDSGGVRYQAAFNRLIKPAQAG